MSFGGKYMAKEYRRKGEGNFSVTPSGGLAYRFRYTDEYGRRRSKSVSGINEKHCYERAEQFLYELERKINFINYETTIPQMVREKIENDYKKNHIGEASYDRYLIIADIIERSSIFRFAKCGLVILMVFSLKLKDIQIVQYEKSIQC